MEDSSQSEERLGENPRRRQVIVHPLLCAIFPVLFFFGHNLLYFDFDVLMRPLIIAAAASVLLTWLLRRPSGDLQRAGLITSTIFLTLFSHGYIYNLAEKSGYYFDADGMTTTEFIINVFYGVFLLAVIYFFKKKNPVSSYFF